jgi:hypothetical protein
MNIQSKKLSLQYREYKESFATALSAFAQTLETYIAVNGDWTIKGFIDVFKNIYAISSDTKVLSKILEVHLLQHFREFARRVGYSLELATCQNWYPDLTFVSIENPEVKFAVDLKTTYVDPKRPGYCHGFTLGSHGEYFKDRNSTKNIQYPYSQYSGHFCLGIIYSRTALTADFESRKYTIDELDNIPSVISNFTFFATEKWKIANDKQGSSNTANIGSINYIPDILTGNGVFAKAGEDIFDDYWINYGQIDIEDKNGNRKPMKSFDEYIKYRRLSMDIRNNSVSQKRKIYDNR